jgi:hypothetical protein
MNAITTPSGSEVATMSEIRKFRRNSRMTARDEDLLHHRVPQRADGLVDEPGAVVERHDADPPWQRPRDARDRPLDLLDHRPGVLAVAHRDHAADALSALVRERAAPDLGAHADVGDSRRRRACRYIATTMPSTSSRPLIDPTPRIASSIPPR